MHHSHLSLHVFAVYFEFFMPQGILQASVELHDVLQRGSEE